MTPRWHDAFHLAHALRCVRKVQPVRWREVLVELRKSRCYRKTFLTDARTMLAFKLSCIYAGIKP